MRPNHSRKPCLGILVWAVAGILLSEAAPCNVPLACLAAACFAIAAFRDGRMLSFGFLVLAVFLVRHELDWRESPGRLPIDLLSQGDPVIQAEGVVTSDPVATGLPSRGPHCRFELQVDEVSAGGRTMPAGFTAEINWAGPPPAWGDKVAVTGGVMPLPAARNPGEFNLADYLARRGIFAGLNCAYPEDNRITAHDRGSPLLAWARNSRAFLQRVITRGIDDDAEQAGLVQTITLGLKQETSIEDRDLFQHVGALHLFVVNGLHVALLATIIALLCKSARINRRAFAVVIIPILFAYALITGLNPGSVRAAIMAAVMFGAAFAERRPFSFNTLAAAALILLAWDTNELYRTGFQFSFGVVAAIILLAGIIQKPLLPIGLPDACLPRVLWTRWQHAQNVIWRRMTELAAVSTAASIGSFPFSAGYFNLMTPSGFIANLALVPIAFGILAEAIFSTATSWFKAVALLFNNVNWLLATVMLGVVHFFAAMPGGHFFVSTSSSQSPECRITVLDLNPGQAIVIQSEGSCWLVDCGSTYSYSRTVRPFLESCGVNRLDGMILTHGAAPSIGAAQDVINDFAPRQIFESSATDRSPTRRTLHTALENAGQPKTIIETGDELHLSPAVTCSVLFPPAGFDGRTASDKSLILRVTDGSNRVLLLSDSGFTGEHWLLDHVHDLTASVVVIGGQSSDLAGTSEFISATHSSAVIRGGPAFAVPASAARPWAVGLMKQGVTPFLQSDTGAVTIDIDHSGCTVTGFMNGQRLTRRSE